MKKSIILVLALILGACVNQSELQKTVAQQIAENKQEQKSANHIFKNTTKLEVAEAMEKVFRLADGSDFRIKFEDSSIKVYRTRLLYIVLWASIYHERWDIKLEQKDKDVTSNIKTFFASQEMLTSFPEGEVLDKELYDLFYSRVNYILGKNKKWITCDDAREVMSDGAPAFLCMAADDKLP